METNLNEKIIKQIKERFSNYEDYYKILQIDKNNVTDEKVKDAYDNRCKQLEGILRGLNGEIIEEIRNLIQQSLDDAYTALKTENSRNNYNNLLDSIEENER